MNRLLERKPQKIVMGRRMVAMHPFYIWRALERFRTMDKLAGNETQFRTQEEIASVLFTNFNGLDRKDQAWVISCKISFGLMAAKQRGYVEEEREKVQRGYSRYFNNEIVEYRGTGRFRSLGNHFDEVTYMESKEEKLLAARESMDTLWAVLVGRDLREDRQRKWLEKRGII